MSACPNTVSMRGKKACTFSQRCQLALPVSVYSDLAFDQLSTLPSVLSETFTSTLHSARLQTLTS